MILTLFLIGLQQEGEPSEVLQQHLEVVASQREQMQQMEVELRAQMIARSRIADFKKCFNAQAREFRKVCDRLCTLTTTRGKKVSLFNLVICFENLF